MQDPITLSQDDLKILFRFAFEEELRRNLAKSGKEPLKEEEICELLFPEFKQFIDNLILDKQTQINTEVMGMLMGDVNEAMKPFEDLAQKFRNYDAGIE